MGEFTNRTKLVLLIETSWAELLAAASQLTPTQLTTPLDGDWTGKDLLAHITAWEKRVLELLQRGRNHADGFQVEGVEDRDVDRVNLGCYEANRARPQTDIQHDFHYIHDQLMTELALWPDNLDHPQWSAWIDGPPLWQIIPGDTYEHYEEHIGVMREA